MLVFVRLKTKRKEDNPAEEEERDCLVIKGISILMKRDDLIYSLIYCPESTVFKKSMT